MACKSGGTVNYIRTEKTNLPDDTVNGIIEHSVPRLNALLFAEWASETQSGKHAICGIFDKVQIMRGGSLPLTFYLYLRTVQTHRDIVEVRLTSPSGIEVASLSIEAIEPPNVLSDDSPVIVQGTSLLTMIFDQIGVYWFDVSYRGESLGKAPLVVFDAPETANVGI